ncbi:cephalosporin hydroxylase [Candidatus Woesearchaeota archaeon]|nr:cephalosporin hydroxylase [Candidatus Woesearchaeota archaeon]
MLLRDFINTKFFFNARNYQNVIRTFHLIFFNTKVVEKNTFWMGRQTLQTPFDAWIFQELIHEVKPDVIVETGTHKGGCSLFFASMCDLIGKGKIISIDWKRYGELPKHKRITYLTGSAISPEIMKKVESMIKPGQTVMVFLDDDHTTKHVMQELRTYGKFVTKGSYMVCEDTNLRHPIRPEFPDPGPMDAVLKFANETKDFKIDKSREKFLLTSNKNGFLKKVR